MLCSRYNHDDTVLVCGTKDLTYQSLCELSVAKQKNPGLSVQGYGACASPLTLHLWRAVKETGIIDTLEKFVKTISHLFNNRGMLKEINLKGIVKGIADTNAEQKRRVGMLKANKDSRFRNKKIYIMRQPYKLDYFDFNEDDYSSYNKMKLSVKHQNRTKFVINKRKTTSKPIKIAKCVIEETTPQVASLEKVLH